MVKFHLVLTQLARWQHCATSFHFKTIYRYYRYRLAIQPMRSLHLASLWNALRYGIERHFQSIFGFVFPSRVLFLLKRFECNVISEMENLAVEVRCGNGVYYKASVVDVFDDHIVLMFDASNKMLFKSPFENVRLPPENGGRENLFVRQQVELYMKSQPSEFYGWWQAVIIQIIGHVHVVQVWISGIVWNVQAPREFIRRVNDRPPITKKDFFKVEIEVPRDLVDNSHIPEACEQFAYSTGIDGCWFDSEKRVLRCISRCELAIKRASFLRFMFVDNLRNLAKIEQMKESSCRRLDARKMVAKKQGKDYFMRKFSVKDRFIRFAKRNLQANIDRAYEIEGIAHIDVNRTRVTFTIYGNTKEATIKARNILDYTMDTVKVPRKLFDGERGRILKEIQRQCRFLHINPFEPDTRCEKHLTELLFIGPIDNVENAKVMMTYHMEHLNKMKELLDEKSKLDRELRKLDGKASGSIGRRSGRGSRSGRRRSSTPDNDFSEEPEDGKGATLTKKRRKKQHGKKRKQRRIEECISGMSNLVINEGGGMSNSEEPAANEGPQSDGSITEINCQQTTQCCNGPNCQCPTYITKWMWFQS